MILFLLLCLWILIGVLKAIYYHVRLRSFVLVARYKWNNAWGDPENLNPIGSSLLCALIWPAVKYELP